ncbi:efflux RND transporter periplasmic adaptor subunit [Stenotrophomonas panacihumi]|uniref:efflux RND transporter periplasmic adaptor subunit n=2 Tax=Stenotrophomonas panacihumi TaxID=676599 RepID=UPI000D33994D|nr:efflux RND transporter periplasmic adaptor subunit [Stenotrophomonas panacihumi]PTN56155.1 efflux RND transporter periplasmic adaptor subunit [Stenotrophomonas panacihumi]
MSHPNPTPAPTSRPSRRLPVVIAAILVVGAVAAGLFVRATRAHQLEATAQSRSIPTVGVIHPTSVPVDALELPGRVEAWSRAPIYARVSGYLKRWNADIGQPVKAGQVLAEIETPDLDQELSQAQAELASARSDAAIAKAAADRWQRLVDTRLVSRQDADERVATSQSREASAQALNANVARAQTLARYKQLVAPFDGVVTERNTDVGALINTGSSTGSALFVVSDLSRLRVYVSVPQRQVASIRPGVHAQLVVPEHPGKTYDATVQSLSQAIDSDSGAMLVQLAVDNAAGELLPGAYATVRFDVANGGTTLGLPPSALIIGKGGVHLAVVDAQGKAQLREVRISRDLGNVVEFADGLKADDRVIDNPPDGIATGDAVRVAEAAPEQKKAG